MDAPVSFSHLLVSLAHQAMHDLGEGPAPGRDLEAARHSIEMLRILADKTRGNLDAQESKLLDTLLRETQSKYAEKSGAAEPQKA